jgi:hypothetical protein
MKNRIIFLLLSFFIFNNAISQDLAFNKQQDEVRLKGVLTSGEIVILNDFQQDLHVRCSYNRKEWKHTLLAAKKVYSLIIPRKESHLYVEICQRTLNDKQSDCETYKIPPTKRYVIAYDEVLKKVVLKKAMAGD